jgi:transposase
MVRRKYTKEFKMEAVRLAEDSDVPVDEVARELGIHPNTLYKWRREYLADGEAADEPKSIGVQVKFYSEKSAPRQLEWLKFLSGCFSRRLESAIFITTGKLTGDQRREAQEARITIIEGKDEITRLSQLHSIGDFELFD